MSDDINTERLKGEQRNDPNTASFTTSRRLFLLLCALIFITGCAVLSLTFRAVPKLELATAFFALVYIQVANLLKPYETKLSSNTSGSGTGTTTSSPPLSPKKIRPLARNDMLGRNTVRAFIFISFLLSVIIPWLWLLFFSPTTQQASLLGPHLFIMMTQVLFEIWSYRQTVSFIIRVGIPVGFVAYRLRLLVNWVSSAYSIFRNYQQTNPDKDYLNNEHSAMLALAATNLVFWSFIFFYVLLLKVCPPYFAAKSKQINSINQKRQ